MDFCIFNDLVGEVKLTVHRLVNIKRLNLLKYLMSKMYFDRIGVEVWSQQAPTKSEPKI